MKATDLKFKGKRIDNGEWVEGYYFKTPLTDENSGTDPSAGWFFLTGETRHCISSETGVVFVVNLESVEMIQLESPKADERKQLMDKYGITEQMVDDYLKSFGDKADDLYSKRTVYNNPR